MKILFVNDIKEHVNEFIKVHINILKNMGHQVTASKKEFWDMNNRYDMIVINWPEYFFEWRNTITDNEVEKLNNSILYWQSTGSRILTFFHDEYSHFGRSNNLNLIFDICYGKSDIIVHLGNYSKEKYKNIYPLAKHIIIKHPLYKDFLFHLDKNESRNKLNYNQNELLVIVPGAIRNKKEIDYCLRVFRNVDHPKKRLVFLRTSYMTKPKTINSVKKIKSLIYYLLFRNKYKYIDNVVFLNGYMKPDRLSHFFTASDAVIVPRIDILNSGNIILAAQFGKPMIGTGSGNMNELFTYLNQLIIKPGEPIDKESINELFKLGSDKSTEIIDQINIYSDSNKIQKKWQEIV